jgi:hypothetical protein
LTGFACKYIFLRPTADRQSKRKKCNFADKTKSAKIKLFFLSFCRENFPTHHQRFLRPDLERRTIKYFMATKKILFDVFSKTYFFLCTLSQKKGNCIFYFYLEKVVLFD